MSENTVAATTDDVEPPTVTAAGATVEATPATVPANAPTNPVPTGSNRDDDELQPLLAGWLKDRQAFLDTVGRALHRNAYRASWHGLRLPLYALRLVVLAPRGAGRVLRALFLFLSDAEGRPLRVDAVTESDAATWLRLRKERNERVRRRLIVAGTLTAPVALLVLATLWPAVAAGAAGVLVLALTVVTVKDTLVGILVGVVAGGVTVWLLPRVIAPLHLSPPPWWVLVVAGFVGVLVLGYVGRPIGTPLVKPAVLLAGVHEPLRAPHVMKALCSLGISGMRDPEQIGLLFDVAREGPGYRVDLELPAGVSASAVLARRSQLSAALRREVGTVWPAVGKRHEGHLVLYAADEPMTGAKQPRWPLLKTGEVDLFNPVPMFTDQQGRWVNVTLAYANFVIGALPRMGKTFLLREALLIAGLDPRARVYAIDGKGTGDLSPCELYAHFNARGDRPEQVERVLHAFRGLREEMRRRADVIDGLPREEAPESKVGSRLAARVPPGAGPGADRRRDRRDTSLFRVRRRRRQGRQGHPRRAGRHRHRPGEARAGGGHHRAAGHAEREPLHHPDVDLEQRGAPVLPQGVQSAGERSDPRHRRLQSRGGRRDVRHGRQGHRVPTRGGRGAEDRAVGPRARRGGSEKVALRARQMRLSAGRLSRHAAGEVMEAEAEQVVLLDDVRTVFRGADALHLPDIITRLALLRPALYGSLNPRTLGGQLRQAGVEVASVYVAGKPPEQASAKGVKRSALEVFTTEVIGDIDQVDDGPDPGQRGGVGRAPAGLTGQV
jgi:S-DNA-T family DNA segregation ATPase FtsK/SpoIIIE